MKWKRELKNFKIDEIRTIKKFLFLPKTILNETRWLENAHIKQKYKEYQFFIYNIGIWEDIEWNYNDEIYESRRKQGLV